MDMPQHGIVESAYLLVAAECGWLTLGFYALWLLYYLFIAWRLLKPMASTKYFYIPCGAVGGLLACYLQTMLEWVLRQAMNFIVIMILFAMIAYLSDAMRRVQQAKPTPGVPPKRALGDLALNSGR